MGSSAEPRSSSSPSADSGAGSSSGRGLAPPVTPPAPSVSPGLGRLLPPGALPRVFAGLQPGPAEPLPTPGNPVVAAAVSTAADSTVKVQGLGCGGVKSGSGFIAAPGLVVTNAHVVAGIATPYVFDFHNRRHTNTQVVVFDPEMDVAVLRVGGLTGRPLPLVRVV